MENKLFWRKVIIGMVAGIIISSTGSAFTATPLDKNIYPESKKINDKNKELMDDSYTNLSIGQVWDFISDSSNGIQFLIDVRTPQEYRDERLFTSSLREKPRLFPLQFMEFGDIFLRFFMRRYDNKEIILYCRSANRSFIATKLLIDIGFSGTIYNIIGGINEWKAADLPTVKGFFS